MSQFPEITSNLSTANFRASILTLASQIASGGSSGGNVTITGSLPSGTNSIGSVNPDSTGSGSVTASTPLVVTTTNFGTLAFQSNAVATGNVTIEASVDGTTYTATTYTALTSGNTSSTFSAATATIGQIDVSGFKNIRFRSNTITAGSVGITYNLSKNVSNVMLDNPLPQGTNTIGNVTIAPNIGGLTQATGTLTAATSASVLSAGVATKYLAIQNNSSSVMYVNFNSAATTGSFQIVAGATYIFETDYLVNTSVNLYSVTGTSAGATYVIVYA